MRRSHCVYGVLFFSCLLCVAIACDDDAANVSRGAAIDNEWGFSMETPRTRTVHCEGADLKTPDADWLCTVEQDGKTGVIYVQSTPVSCYVVSGIIPVYETVTAELWMDGAVTTLSDAQYDYGGGHHNDNLRVTVNGTRLEYNHSSLDYRIRACQPMDCAMLLDDDDAVVENGCLCDRSLPVVCSEVKTDGTFAPLVDTFEMCEGDVLCGDQDL